MLLLSALRVGAISDIAVVEKKLVLLPAEYVVCDVRAMEWGKIRRVRKRVEIHNKSQPREIRQAPSRRTGTQKNRKERPEQ